MESSPPFSSRILVRSVSKPPRSHGSNCSTADEISISLEGSASIVLPASGLVDADRRRFPTLERAASIGSQPTVKPHEPIHDGKRSRQRRNDLPDCLPGYECEHA